MENVLALARVEYGVKNEAVSVSISAITGAASRTA